MNNENNEQKKTPEEIAAETARAAAEAAAAMDTGAAPEPTVPGADGKPHVAFWKKPAVKKTGWGLLALGVIGAGVWAGLRFFGGGAAAAETSDDTSSAE